MRQTSEMAADLLSVFRQRLWPQPQPRQRWCTQSFYSAVVSYIIQLWPTCSELLSQRHQQLLWKKYDDSEPLLLYRPQPS